MIGKLKYLAVLIPVVLLLLSLPELLYKNSGESISKGSIGNGSLENSYILPYKGSNFDYFSSISYFLMGNAYVNSRVYKTIMESYQACEKHSAGVKFRIMECSSKHGGKIRLHRTHQNGLSIDFMVPKKVKDHQFKALDKIGLWHYLLEFDDEGKSKFASKISIDFETMARHILSLDDAARSNGLMIEKVIFMIELKDDLFATPSGKEIQRRGIYFAQSLPDFINRVHDDHYHVDFKISD